MIKYIMTLDSIDRNYHISYLKIINISTKFKTYIQEDTPRQ